MHLITALPMFGFLFLLLTNIIGLDNFKAIMIAVIAYLYDAFLQTKIDYLEDKIKECSKP